MLIGAAKLFIMTEIIIKDVRSVVNLKIDCFYQRYIYVCWKTEERRSVDFREYSIAFKEISSALDFDQGSTNEYFAKANKSI